MEKIRITKSWDKRRYQYVYSANVKVRHIDYMPPIDDTAYEKYIFNHMKAKLVGEVYNCQDFEIIDETDQEGPTFYTMEEFVEGCKGD